MKMCCLPRVFYRISPYSDLSEVTKNSCGPCLDGDDVKMTAKLPSCLLWARECISVVTDQLSSPNSLLGTVAVLYGQKEKLRKPTRRVPSIL